MTTEAAPKGLLATVLTGPRHAPNGGLSAHVREVVVIGDRIPELQEASADRPAVRLVERLRGFFVAEPVAPLLPGLAGYSASGAHIEPAGHTPEWRAATGSYLPIPLHDRAQAQRPALST